MTEESELSVWTRANERGRQHYLRWLADAEREKAEQAAKVQRATEEREEADQRTLATMPQTPAEWRTWGYALARQHRVTIRESRAIPEGVWGYAEQRTRTIVVPPDWHETPDGRAGLLHEIGHLRAGSCPRQEPHRPDPSVTRWHRCLECERLAWAEAMRLFPFSRSMFTDLQRSLTWVRRKTPASLAAREAARELVSDTHFAAVTIARTERQRRLDMHEEMVRWASEPRVLNRRERMYAEIQQWAKEAKS